MRLTALIAGVTLLLTAATAADAAVVVRDIAIKNAGFEADPRDDGGYCRGCVPDWAATDFGVPFGYGSSGSGVIDPSSDSGVRVPEGQQFGFVDTFTLNGTPYQGGLMQILNEDVILGTTYSLSLDVVRRLANPMADWIAEIMVGEGNRVVASGTLTSSSVPVGGFSPLTIGFTGTADDAGKQLSIRFRSMYDAAQGSEYRAVGIDNVRMTADAGMMSAVPEPATWAMMIAGFGMVGAAMRRSRRMRSFAA